MRGRRDKHCDWTPEEGLSILNSTEWRSILPPPNTFETIGAWMGLSREAVRLEIVRVQRKFRIRLEQRGVTLEQAREAFRKERRLTV